MHTKRIIGRWTMTALVVNTIIGSAIFGVPSEAIRLVGNRSPSAMIAAALCMALIMLPVAEVASRFSNPGGLYLYARTAFGRLVGLQVGWFWLLAIVGGGAAAVNLFLTYLTPFFPSIAHGPSRILAILLLIVMPTVANYLGVRQGALLSVVFTVAKLLPLVLVIVLGTFKPASRVDHHALVAPAWIAWPKVLLLLLYAFSGWEDALLPTGEVKEPERTIPFALLTSLVVCAIVYSLFQYVIVQTVGAGPSDNAVTDTVSVLLGPKAVPLSLLR